MADRRQRDVDDRRVDDVEEHRGDEAGAGGDPLVVEALDSHRLESIDSSR